MKTLIFHDNNFTIVKKITMRLKKNISKKNEFAAILKGGFESRPKYFNIFFFEHLNSFQNLLNKKQAIRKVP